MCALARKGMQMILVAPGRMRGEIEQDFSINSKKNKKTAAAVIISI